MKKLPVRNKIRITEALCAMLGHFLFSIDKHLGLLFCMSAGKPKKPHALKTICLMLGPDFITDIIEVGICMSYLLSVFSLKSWL